LKLNISELSKNPGAKESFEFVLTDLPVVNNYQFEEPLVAKGEIINTGQGLALEANVQSVVSTTCARCLEEIKVPLEFSFSEVYVHENDLAQDGEDLESDMVMTYNDVWLDLAEAVKENVLIHLPMRMVCDPDCLGLCPSCGKNLKNGPCQCENRDVDPRLAVLAKLKINN